MDLFFLSRVNKKARFTT